MVWAIFVNTMKNQKTWQVKANLIYGGTEVSDRQKLINDFALAILW